MIQHFYFIFIVISMQLLKLNSGIKDQKITFLGLFMILDERESCYLTALQQYQEIESIYKYLMKGTNDNPIDLDSDTEETPIQVKKEEARNKMLIENAILTKNPLELSMAAIKTKIKGDLNHKKHTLNRAIIRFFQKEIGINISFENFHPKPEVDYGQNNNINPLQFLLYGVDFLTTAMIKDRFTLQNVQLEELFWINSSCCKLKYKTQADAQLILKQNVADKTALLVKVDDDLDAFPQGWFKLNKEYQIFGFKRELYMRYSTEVENDLPKEINQNFQKFEQLNGQLLPHLFDQFKAHSAYQKIVIQIERDRNSNQRRGNRRDFGSRRDGNRGRNRDGFRQRDRSRQRYPQRQSRGYSRQPIYPSERRYNNYRSDRQDNFRNQPYGRSIRTVYGRTYEHQPVEMRRQRNNHNQNLPINGNKIYDCNDLDNMDLDNLSFEFRSQSQHDSDDDNLEGENMNTSIPLKKAENQKNGSFLNNSQQNLSFNFNNSFIDKSQNNQNNQQANLSLIMDPYANGQEEPENVSVNMGESQVNQEDSDYSIMMGLNDISPINESQDASIQMNPPKPSNKKKTLQDRRVQKKGPFQINLNVDQESEGY